MASLGGDSHHRLADDLPENVDVSDLNGEPVARLDDLLWTFGRDFYATTRPSLDHSVDLHSSMILLMTHKLRSTSGRRGISESCGGKARPVIIAIRRRRET